MSSGAVLSRVPTASSSRCTATGPTFPPVTGPSARPPGGDEGRHVGYSCACSPSAPDRHRRLRLPLPQRPGNLHPLAGGDPNRSASCQAPHMSAGTRSCTASTLSSAPGRWSRRSGGTGLRPLGPRDRACAVVNGAGWSAEAGGMRRDNRKTRRGLWAVPRAPERRRGAPRRREGKRPDWPTLTTGPTNPNPEPAGTPTSRTRTQQDPTAGPLTSRTSTGSPSTDPGLRRPDPAGSRWRACGYGPGRAHAR